MKTSQVLAKREGAFVRLVRFDRISNAGPIVINVELVVAAEPFLQDQIERTRLTMVATGFNVNINDSAGAQSTQTFQHVIEIVDNLDTFCKKVMTV